MRTTSSHGPKRRAGADSEPVDGGEPNNQEVSQVLERACEISSHFTVRCESTKAWARGTNFEKKSRLLCMILYIRQLKDLKFGTLKSLVEFPITVTAPEYIPYIREAYEVCLHHAVSRTVASLSLRRDIRELYSTSREKEGRETLFRNGSLGRKGPTVPM